MSFFSRRPQKYVLSEKKNPRHPAAGVALRQDTDNQDPIPMFVLLMLKH